MGRLDGKLALVTGAGTGIGRGVAIELASEGANVVLHYSHSGEGARQAVETITDRGGKAIALEADLSQVQSCLDLVDRAAGHLGGLDILVNNSGVTRAVPFEETTPETYDEVLNINVRAHYFCAQRAVRHLIARGGGAILNTASIHAHGGRIYHSAYAATKGAIVALTRELAVELAPKRIRVNAVAPGLIEVPRYFETMPGYTTETGRTRVPWGRVGRPVDVAKAAVFLVSEEADFVTGQVLYVDGGTSAVMGLFDDLTSILYPPPPGRTGR